MQIEYNPDLILTQEYTEAEVQNYTGSFCGFVLLKSSYHLQALTERLQKTYNIAAAPNGMDFCDSMQDFMQDLMLDVPGAMVTVSFMNEPIPEGEAETAAMHAVWEGANHAAKTHTAHLMIAVLPDTMSAIDAGKLYSRIISAALEDDAVLAVYTSGTILEPMQFCQHTAEAGDLLPLDNLIFIGTYVREGGNCGYTVGLDAFGKDELEILDSNESSESVAYVLRECANIILTDNLPSQWYFTAEIDGITWEGRRKDGVMVEGHSIQLTHLFSV